MNCKSCGSYYPNDEKSCPYCGYVMSKAERKAALKEAKANARQISREEQKRGEIALRTFWNEDTQPVSAVLISTQDVYRKSALGAAGRALLGGAILGEFGAAVGLATTKAKSRGQKATFAVKYASGRKGTETVDMRSERFKVLSALLVD